MTLKFYKIPGRNVIGILPSGFERHHICIFNDETDIENDVFELRRTGNAGVHGVQKYKTVCL